MSNYILQKEVFAVKLNDDNNIKHIAQSSGKFLYKPQNQKFSVKAPIRKKLFLFSGPNTLFDDESIEFNDLDSNMLNRNMIKYLPTDSLRLELQLERAEKRIKKIDDEIKTSKLLEMEETSRNELLTKKKNQLNKEMTSYKSQYRKLGFIYLLADMISDIGIKTTEKINNLKDYVFSKPLFKTILEKMPGYTEKQKIKKLNMLQEKIVCEINKNSKSDPKKLEYLFSKKEELSS